jgi:5-methylcytosine-specific restriction endonuclease McrA
LTRTDERYVGKSGGGKADIWREMVYQRDRFRCQSCGAKGGELEAHHIYPKEKYPELDYKLWNGMTLCEDCHARAHLYHHLREKLLGVPLKRIPQEKNRKRPLDKTLANP